MYKLIICNDFNINVYFRLFDFLRVTEDAVCVKMGTKVTWWINTDFLMSARFQWVDTMKTKVACLKTLHVGFEKHLKRLKTENNHSQYHIDKYIA